MYVQESENVQARKIFLQLYVHMKNRIVKRHVRPIIFCINLINEVDMVD